LSAPVIVWLRRDLRLADQAALRAAVEAGPVIPVYVLDDETPRHRAMGGASRWWLHHSLASLDSDLRERGSRLILRRGRCDEVLAGLAAETGAREVHALHHYEPWWRNAERAVAAVLKLTLHDGNYLAPPGSVLSGSGTPYRIYTPFWRALLGQMPPPAPGLAPGQLAAPAHWPDSDRPDDWQLLPNRPDWAGGLRSEWTPGEAGARQRLTDFAARSPDYVASRNLPGEEGTSRLSPHLHFGEISPATVWHALASNGGSTQTYLGQLGWRDYAQNVLLQFPEYAARPAKPEFERLAWRDPESDPAAARDLRAWQQGRTGYPVVDAGMRQLWASGWMHNRVRMIAASFLIKHLLIDWRHGERWFWDTLVDADHAQNAVNWQWSAGSGVDANMFVRIMAPLSQSEKFDAGSYVARWVPELAGLAAPLRHDPPDEVRPATYPARLIGHAEGRARALEAWAKLKA
jgi:deoxyribodipyrimidine photo-lyase